MSTLIFKDTPATTLAGPITSVATTLAVASGAGASFPQPTSGQQFYAYITDAATQTLKEVILVTAVSGDTMTIIRGQGSGIAASALPWLAGDFLVHGPVAEMFSSFQQISGSGTALFYEGFDTSSTGNAVTVPTTSPSITSPSAGDAFFIVKGGHTNTGSITCSVGSGPTLPVYYSDGSTLQSQDWPAGTGAWLYYGAGGGGSYQFLGLSSRAVGDVHYGIAAGTSDALIVSVYPPISALLDGQIFEISLTASNATTTPSIAINGLPAKTIVSNANGALAANDLQAGTKVLMAYNGTNVQLFAPVSSQILTKIPSGTIFYVDSAMSGASDSNDGLSDTAGHPFLTVQGAINAISSKYLCFGTVNVYVKGAGPYSGFSLSPSQISSWNLQGDGSSTTVINSPSSSINNGYGISAPAVTSTISGFKIESYLSNIIIGSGGSSTIENCQLTTPAFGGQSVISAFGASIQLGGTLTWTGGGSAASFIRSSLSSNVGYGYTNGFTTISLAVAVSGSPTVTVGFVWVDDSASIVAFATVTTQSGSVTGPRYSVSLNGVVNSQGAGASYFLGSTAGSTSTGGQYV